MDHRTRTATGDETSPLTADLDEDETGPTMRENTDTVDGIMRETVGNAKIHIGAEMTTDDGMMVDDNKTQNLEMSGLGGARNPTTVLNPHAMATTAIPGETHGRATVVTLGIGDRSPTAALDPRRTIKPRRKSDNAS